MTTTGVTLGKESILMGLLDKLLGVNSRKPKQVVTDPVALARIERTQRELETRLDALDERVSPRLDNLDQRVTAVELVIKPPTSQPPKGS